MKDFLDGLDDRLRVIAEEQAAELAPAPAARRTRRRRPTVLAGLTTALATAGAVFAMNGVSMADLPILETRTVDASGVATTAEPARAAGVDFSDAHTFGTVNGPGYVFLTPSDDVLCLSIPTPDGVYPGSCEKRETVEERGLRTEAVGTVGAEARALFAFVLPGDATDVQVTGPGNRDGAVSIESGIAVGSIQEAVEIRWSEHGQPRSAAFDGAFAPGATTTETCPDGRSVTRPVEELRPAPSAQLDRDALRRACR